MHGKPALGTIRVFWRNAEMNKTLPTDADRPLDAASRAAAGRLFARLAAHLEELK